jgi:hypothetical protein
MKAYEVLEKYGWIKGQDGSTQTGFCAIGAIKKAYREKAAIAMLQKLRESVGVIWAWNDKIKQRKSTVVSKLKVLDI